MTTFCDNCNDKGYTSMTEGFAQTATSPAEPPCPEFCMECTRGRAMCAEYEGMPVCKWCGEPVDDHGDEDAPVGKLAGVAMFGSIQKDGTIKADGGNTVNLWTHKELVEALCELKARRDGWPASAWPGLKCPTCDGKGMTSKSQVKRIKAQQADPAEIFEEVISYLSRWGKVMTSTNNMGGVVFEIDGAPFEWAYRELEAGDLHGPAGWFFEAANGEKLVAWRQRDGGAR